MATTSVTPALKPRYKAPYKDPHWISRPVDPKVGPMAYVSKFFRSPLRLSSEHRHWGVHEYAVAMCLASHMRVGPNTGGWHRCHPGIKSIARITGLSYSAVVRALKNLCDKENGIFDRTRRWAEDNPNRRLPNEYHLVRRWVIP